MSKKKIFASLCVVLLVLSSGLYLFVRQSYAVTRTWDGGGTTNDWSDCPNWSADTCPTSSDIAQFNGTSTKDATIDSGFAGSVSGVNITAAYTGTITQSTSLTIGINNFAQAGGTWNGGSQTFIVNTDGNFTVSGGVHHATTGTFQVERNFTYSGGTLDMTGATLGLTDSNFQDNSTVSCTGVLGGTIDILKDSPSGATETTVTIGSGCNVTFVSSPSFQANIVNNGTINATDITMDASFTQSGTLNMTGTLYIIDNYFLDTASISCTGNFGPNVNLNKTTASSGTSGSFTVGSGCSINVTPGSFVYGNIVNNGTINGTDITTQTGATQNGTLNLTTFYIVDTTWQNSFDVTCTGLFGPPININTDDSTSGLSGTFTVGSGCEVTLTSGSFVYGSIVNNGTINVVDLTTNSSFTQNGTLNMTGTLTLGGSSFQNGATLTCNGVLSTSAMNLVLNKTNATSPTLTIGSDCTIPGDFTRTNGIVGNPASAKTLTILGNLSISTSDTFGGANLTIQFTGTNNQSITQNAGTVSSPVVINKPNGKAVTLATNFQINSTGLNLTLTAGTLKNSSSTLTVNNIFTINGAFVQGTGNVSAGTYTIGTTGSWNNRSTGDVSVGAGGVANSGIIYFDGTADGCGEADAISVTSSTGGTQRAWTGAGDFTLYDVSVQDQGGSAYVPVYSGTSVSGNGNNFVFKTSCPVPEQSSSLLRRGTTIQGGTTLQ